MIGQIADFKKIFFFICAITLIYSVPSESSEKTKVQPSTG